MSIFSDLKPDFKANRNGFDLGCFSTFSTKAGYILPVFSRLTLPDGEYQIDVKQLLRTQPLQKAAFTGFSINYDVVWCPYNHLYSSFNQFIAQRQEKNTTRQPSKDYIPVFDFNKFIKPVFAFALIDYILSFCTDLVESSQGVDSPKPRYVFASSHLPYESVFLGVIRNLDMLEYGNYLPLLKNVYKTLTSTPVYIEGVERAQNIDWSRWSNRVEGDTTIYGVGAFFTLNAGDNTLNPFEEADFSQFINFFDTALDVAPFGSSDKVSTMFPDYSPNIFSVLAYNKFFYEYYRNEYYDEKFAINKFSVFGFIQTFEFDYVQLFNCDDFMPGSLDVSDLNSATFWRLVSMFALKPHQYKKDMFTAPLPSMQFGDVSVASAQSIYSRLLGKTDGSDTPFPISMVFDGVSTSYVRANGEHEGDTKFTFDPTAAISVLELRRADALQRYKERMLRAGDKVKDIFKSQGWSEPLSEKSYEPIFLGSFDGRLDINVVAATTDSQSAELAQLGANGVATVNGSKVKITTKDFGMLMVLFHIDKDAVYDSFGISQHHTFNEVFDYPFPVLQNISLAPVPSYLVNTFDNSDKVVGFLPRAFYFKTAIDKVHGEFYGSLPYEWTSVRPRDGYTGQLQVFGSFSDWVAPREDLILFDQKSFLYIQPRCTDSIFKLLSDSKQTTDPFVVNCRFDCYAVEPLPVIGLPI